MDTILIPIHCQKYLENIPESGMGYHKVDLYLTNGSILYDRIILNTKELVKLNYEELEANDIFYVKRFE